MSATVSPRAPKARAIARPMPLDAPVTATTLMSTVGLCIAGAMRQASDTRVAGRAGWPQVSTVVPFSGAGIRQSIMRRPTLSLLAVVFSTACGPQQQSIPGPEQRERAQLEPLNRELSG